MTDKLLRTGEVAERLGFSVRTILCWAETGKLASLRTPGGQRRYREADVQAAERAIYGPEGRT